MKELAANDARTHLVDLLARAEHGERTIVAADGESMIQFVPIAPAHDVEAARAAIQRMRERARQWGIKATPDEIKSWIDEGRP